MTGWKRVRNTAVATALFLLAGCETLPRDVDAKPDVDMPIGAAAWLEANRHRLPMVRAFVSRMPKGGDLHSHLSGAVYAESYLEWAAQQQFCVDLANEALVPAPCTEAENLVRADRLLGMSRAYNALIDRLSTRNLAYGRNSGHAQFFDAFGAFGALSSPLERGDAMLAEVANRAAAQHIQYLEIMLSFQGGAVRALGARVPWAENPNLESRRRWLLDNGLAGLVSNARENLDLIEHRYRDLLRCGTSDAEPACSVTVRFIAQTTRTKPPEEVFAQLVYAFELVEADPRVVAVNLVAPEDHPVALRDYSLHMQMVGFLSRARPRVGVALHAGELVLGLVPPKHLRFHIRQAVEIASARRIGHGVDIFYEDNPFELMKEMRDRGVLVEICLTSNDVILGVRDDAHPFPDYLAAGVPVTLASDDEGVSRIDLSNEYLRAVLSYDLGYAALKRLARNSLEHSFLAGPSLWRTSEPFTVVETCAVDRLGSDAPSAPCRAFLDSSERAAQQWRLEREFDIFENLPWFH